MHTSWEEAGWEQLGDGVARRRMPGWDETIGVIAGTTGVMIVDTQEDGAQQQDAIHRLEENVVDGIILQPYPYADAGHIVVLRSTNQRLHVNRGGLSFQDFRDLRDGSTTLSAMAAMAVSSAPSCLRPITPIHMAARSGCAGGAWSRLAACSSRRTRSTRFGG